MSNIKTTLNIRPFKPLRKCVLSPDREPYAVLKRPINNTEIIKE